MRRKGTEEEEGKKAREDREKGASRHFYSESGIPGCCQTTVGWSLDKMLTVDTPPMLLFTYCL